MTAEARDLPCPECGADLLRVVDTRYVNGRVRRRRVCLAGHRATTVETLANRPEPMLAAIEDVEASMARLLALLEQSGMLHRGARRDKSGDEAA